MRTAVARFRQPNRELTVRQVRRVEELLPAGHLARFVWASLMSLDFGPIEALYPSIQGGPGTSPFHPRVPMALWIYGMCQGLSTAAAIAKACALRDDFRWLAGGLRLCDQTLLNFVARAAGNDALLWIWFQVLWALQDAGQIDLSAVLEDGTKVRANASPRSFRPASEIAAAVEQLKSLLAARLDSVAKQADATAAPTTDERAVQILRQKLARAELAQSELERRQKTRHTRPAGAPRREKLAAAGFKHDEERDVLLCPAGESLTFRGTYPTTNRKGTYRLYQRSDCTACPLKASCTDGRGRRVKIQDRASAPPQPEAAAPASAQIAPGEPAAVVGPRASLTDPQAVLMLATSEKHFAPSYNADIAVTRQGFIVSQFLTQNPTDYHSFERAFPAVLDTLGRPDCWIGDGHYGTLANLLLAQQHQVPLYAPAPGGEGPCAPSAATIAEAAPVATPEPASRFGREDFVHPGEPDVLICPGKKELRFVNVYPAANGRTSYKLYQRSNCSDCDLRGQCTSAPGRRVKVPVAAENATHPTGDPAEPDPLSPEIAEALLRAQRERLANCGERTRKLRGQTSEPVNAQLKLHGLDRLHVRGLGKGSAVLTLACIAHNLLKWHTREVARVELAAA